MKISLIIPAYNEERYLGACLEHAIRNSGGRFQEIIVVNNASTDGTATVAAGFPDVRVVNEPRKGLTSARQRGFQAAGGDLLAYLDADTRLPAGWFETVVQEFSADPNLASLSGPYVYYDLPRWQQLLVELYWHLLARPMYLAVGYMTVGGNFVIRRSVLEKMGGFDTAIAFYGEDTDIARRASAFGRVKFKPGFFMYTSGRRLAGQGFLGTAGLYTANFLSEVFWHKPATKEYTDIR